MVLGRKLSMEHNQFKKMWFKLYFGFVLRPIIVKSNRWSGQMGYTKKNRWAFSHWYSHCQKILCSTQS